MRNHILILTLSLISTLIGFGQIETVEINLNDSATLILQRKKFILTDQNIDYEQGKYPSKINGRKIFGIDGDLPKYKLIKATFKIDKKMIELETSQMYNPWFGAKPNERFFKLTSTHNELRLKGLFSDGAGTYLSEWKIENKTSERIRLTADERVIIESFYNE